MAFFKKSTKRLIEESIMFAIDELQHDLKRTADEDDNAKTANSIKVLAEAYDIVHRGKAGEF